ncbi:hypothetical protein C9374_010199 [Naegleria lovaniensis]|uniref:HYDIN/VesB/CFA65-like Ig-like domain-containing protein n=1 Tax=Naegleria lovaniensis TaxID=51637 RepID=A0AA88GCU6_NAELO|nr:uncharacterized protein C9374_010199 [Naegleria lovaniensis]KAG2375195.1 hypothetical protein C9374_010199 [Naegleria lovaniensis]
MQNNTQKLRSIQQLRENQPYNGALLECIPSPVVFEYYDEFGKYEMIVEVLNRSAIPTAIRLKNHSNKFFKVKRVDASEGKIAPGLSAKILVTFQPDSLLDYTEQISIISASKDEIILPLLGRRKRPLLTLPRIIDLGHCFIGTEISKEIKCKNTGGKGNFLFQKDYDPTTNIRFLFSSLNEFDHSQIIEVSPFIISPKYFSLEGNEEIPITITFRPVSVGDHEQSVFLIFDNEQVFEIKIQGFGQYPNIELCAISNITNFDRKSHPSLLCFENVYPFQKSPPQYLTHYNDSDIAVDFEWRYINEYADIPVQTHTLNLPFSIKPSSGRIDPRQHINFEVRFTPKELGIYSGYFILFLNNVPIPASCDHPHFYYYKAGFSWFKNSILNSLTTSDPLKYFSSYDEDVDSIEEEQRQTVFGAEKIDVIGSVPVFHCRVHGDTSKLNVTVSPPIVNFNSLEVGAIFEKELFLINNSDFEAPFKWLIGGEEEGIIVDFIPPTGSILPKQRYPVKLLLKCDRYQSFEISCLCEIANSDSIELFVRGATKPQTLRVDTPCIDFGTVETKKVLTDCVQISNTSLQELFWEVDIPENDAIICSPKLGMLRVGESVLVNVSIESFYSQIIKHSLVFKVKDGPPQFVEVHADIQEPKVILDKYYHDLGKSIKVGDEVEVKVRMKNISQIRAEYCWYDLGQFAAESRGYEIRLENEKGQLLPEEEAYTSVILKALSPTPSLEEVFPCFLQDDKTKFMGIKLIGSIIDSSNLVEQIGHTTA